MFKYEEAGSLSSKVCIRRGGGFKYIEFLKRLEEKNNPFPTSGK